MFLRYFLISLFFVLFGTAMIYLAPRYIKSGNAVKTEKVQKSEMSDSLDAVVDKALLELQNPQGSPMESIMAIRQVLEIDPNHLKANFTLGALSFSTGQYERAIERMSKVVEIAPETEEAYKILVESYNNLGRVDSAESTVRAYMSRFPEGQFIQEFQKIINN